MSVSEVVLLAVCHLGGYALLLYVIHELLVTRKRTLLLVLYFLVSGVLVAYPTYRYAGGPGSLSPMPIFAFGGSLLFALLFWVPMTLDLRRLGQGGSVLLRVEVREQRRPWQWVRVLPVLLIVFACGQIWQIWSCSSSQPCGALLLYMTGTATSGFFLTVGLVTWLQIARLNPNAIMDEGLWLDGGRPGAWLNTAGKDFIPWGDVRSYDWQGTERDGVVTLVVKVETWTGKTELHSMDMPEDKKAQVVGLLGSFVSAG